MILGLKGLTLWSTPTWRTRCSSCLAFHVKPPPNQLIPLGATAPGCISSNLPITLKNSTQALVSLNPVGNVADVAEWPRTDVHPQALLMNVGQGDHRNSVEANL